MDKNKIIRDVKNIILKYANPERIYLYGSQANDEALKGSDIDIAFDDKNFKEMFLIKDEVEAIATLIKIDISNIATANERFSNRVKSTAKVIYSATKQLRAEDGLFNFSNALDKFDSVIKREESLKKEGFGDMFLDLVVKRFEFTYEMSWKALKRYLSYLGVEEKSPRFIFKEAYSLNILTDESIWLDMIEQRNLSAHVYDEYQIKVILDKKEDYLRAFNELKAIMTSELITEDPES